MAASTERARSTRGGAFGRADTADNRRKRRQHLQRRRVTRNRAPIPDTDGPPVHTLRGQCGCRDCIRGDRPLAGIAIGEDGHWPRPHLKLAADVLDGHRVKTGPVYWLSFDCWQIRQAPRLFSLVWTRSEDKAWAKSRGDELEPCDCPLCVAARTPAPAPQDDAAPPEVRDPALAETTLAGAAERGYVAAWQVVKRDAADEAETRRAHARARAEGWVEQADGKWVRA